MMVFETENSRYEVDFVNKRIRRTGGKVDPTERQGPDLVWKNYVHLDRVGGRYLIDWDGQGRGTITSPVIHEADVSPTWATKEAVS